jgi:hypothetical protein
MLGRGGPDRGGGHVAGRLALADLEQRAGHRGGALQPVDHQDPGGERLQRAQQRRQRQFLGGGRLRVHLLLELPERHAMKSLTAFHVRHGQLDRPRAERGGLGRHGVVEHRHRAAEQLAEVLGECLGTGRLDREQRPRGEREPDLDLVGGALGRGQHGIRALPDRVLAVVVEAVRDQPAVHELHQDLVPPAVTRLGGEPLDKRGARRHLGQLDQGVRERPSGEAIRRQAVGLGARDDLLAGHRGPPRPL